MCPACNEPLIAFEFEGVEIDACVACGGVWLDAGELEWIGELEGLDRRELARLLAEGKGARGQRRCPRCRRKLRRIEAGGNRKVELDRCPVGDGLWLDRGELEAFVGSFDTGERGVVARRLAAMFPALPKPANHGSPPR
jgi:Zn-finger nucleic acid-binding protein